jgi:hypothetical protein
LMPSSAADPPFGPRTIETAEGHLTPSFGASALPNWLNVASDARPRRRVAEECSAVHKHLGVRRRSGSFS